MKTLVKRAALLNIFGMLLVLFSIQSLSFSQNRCNTTLTFLSSRIPSVQNSEISSIRGQVLATDIVETMKQANAQGLSPHAAVRATLDQAREFDASSQEALQTARDTDALGTTDDQFLAILKNGRLDLRRCDGIRDNALCSAVITKIGAIANRAVAAEMECHIRAGTWPN